MSLKVPVTAEQAMDAIIEVLPHINQIGNAIGKTRSVLTKLEKVHLPPILRAEIDQLQTELAEAEHVHLDRAEFRLEFIKDLHEGGLDCYFEPLETINHKEQHNV